MPPVDLRPSIRISSRMVGPRRWVAINALIWSSVLSWPSVMKVSSRPGRAGQGSGPPLPGDAAFCGWRLWQTGDAGRGDRAAHQDGWPSVPAPGRGSERSVLPMHGVCQHVTELIELIGIHRHGGLATVFDQRKDDQRGSVD